MEPICFRFGLFFFFFFSEEMTIVKIHETLASISLLSAQHQFSMTLVRTPANMSCIFFPLEFFVFVLFKSVFIFPSRFSCFQSLSFSLFFEEWSGSLYFARLARFVRPDGTARHCGPSTLKKLKKNFFFFWKTIWNSFYFKQSKV